MPLDKPGKRGNSLVGAEVGPLGARGADLLGQLFERHVDFKLNHGGAGKRAACHRRAAIHDNDLVAALCEHQGGDGATDAGSNYGDVARQSRKVAVHTRADAGTIGPEGGAPTQAARLRGNRGHWFGRRPRGEALDNAAKQHFVRQQLRGRNAEPRLDGNVW